MPEFTRRKNRLDHYDYSADGDYFVTICTADKACIFGRITPNTADMNLTTYGNAVLSAVRRLPAVFPSVRIPAFVIMPNHVHMIIRMTESGHSLSHIVNYLKGTVTKNTEAGIWQKSFYDHIIRNEDDYFRICEYIRLNPAVWGSDIYYLPEHIPNPEAAGSEQIDT